jgi:hypothetical protein
LMQPSAKRQALKVSPEQTSGKRTRQAALPPKTHEDCANEAPYNLVADN